MMQLAALARLMLDSVSSPLPVMLDPAPQKPVAGSDEALMPAITAPRLTVMPNPDLVAPDTLFKVSCSEAAPPGMAVVSTKAALRPIGNTVSVSVAADTVRAAPASVALSTDEVLMKFPPTAAGTLSVTSMVQVLPAARLPPVKVSVVVPDTVPPQVLATIAPLACRPLRALL